MAVLLSLLAALAWGSSDFAAGVSGRQIGAGLAALIVQLVALAVALVGVAFYSGAGPTAAVLSWGLAAGVGNAIGTLAIYRGFAVGQMSVVAPLSAVVAAVLPAIVGLALGERLSWLAVAGLITAIPAIGLVAWQRDPHVEPGTRSGVIEDALSGAGFALLMIGLSQARGAGAWPLVPGLALASLLVLPFGWRDRHQFRAVHPALWLVIAAGILGGLAELLFLVALGYGQLSIVAVLTALYPAATVLLARFVLGERWNTAQAVGLMVAALAVALITVG